MKILTALLTRLFTTKDIETGEVRASIEKLVAGFGAIIPSLLALLATTGLVAPEQGAEIAQTWAGYLANSAEPLTLLILGVLWWRKRDKEDQEP